MKSKNTQEYRYSSGGNPNGEAGEGLMRRLLDLIAEDKKVKKICELGCGNGYFSSALERQGYEVWGVDASKSGIEQANLHYGDRVRFDCLEVGALLASDRHAHEFDLVAAVEVVEHLYRPAELVQCAHRLLRKEGVFVLTTPYHGYLKNLAIALTGKHDRHFNPLWDGGHIKFFSPKTLSVLLAENRFSEIRFSFSGRVPGFWKSMICQARKQ